MFKKFFTGIEFRGSQTVKSLILEAFAGPGSAAVGSLVWLGPNHSPWLALSNTTRPVDVLISGLDFWFQSGSHVTDANINLATFTNTDIIRWNTVGDYSLVYVCNQTTTSENGFYVMDGTTHLLTFVRTFDAAGTGSFVYPMHDITNLYIFKYNGSVGSITLVSSGISGVAWWDIIGSIASQTDLASALGAKQDTLVSGTNIKTVNGTSLLGSGNVVISAGTPYVETVTAQTTVTILAATHGKVTPIVQVKWSDNIVVGAQIEIQANHNVVVTFSEPFSGFITIIG